MRHGLCFAKVKRLLPALRPRKGANWRGYLFLAMRVVVFIDAANVYRDARRAFFEEYDPGIYGQFDPGLLGVELLAMTKIPNPELVGVRVYTGRPDGTLAPKTYAAHLRQSAKWQKNPIVTLNWRPLRYAWGTPPPQAGQPDQKGVQKGVDVHLAIDLVRMYILNQYDLAILASTDTDLLPAVETLYELDRGLGFAPIEASAWASDKMKKKLWVSNRALWCHRLELKHYAKCRDMTDYNVAP